MSGYCSPNELRTAINKTGTTGSGSDEALQVIIDAVSDMINRFLNRPDGFIAQPYASARVFIGTGEEWQPIDECVEISEVAVKDSPSSESYTIWTSSDYIPFSGSVDYPAFDRLPYTGLLINPNGGYSTFTSGKLGKIKLPTVRVTARWGYALETPPVIKQAAISLAARWFKQGESAWSDTLASSDMGQFIYRSSNADIRQMLENTRLRKVAIG